MNYKTFEEWKAAGFHVMLGEKSHRRNELGKAVFSQKQVEKNRKRSYQPPDYDYEECYDGGTDPSYYGDSWW